MSGATGNYVKTHAAALADPAGFWADKAEGIDWIKRWDSVIDDARKPFYRWFAGGVLNTCHNCIDRHVAAGRGDATALIYDSPVTGTVRRYSYAELLDEVGRVAAMKWTASSAGEVPTRVSRTSAMCRWIRWRRIGLKS